MLCATIGINAFVFAFVMRTRAVWKAPIALGGVVLLALALMQLWALQGAWRPWFWPAHLVSSLVVGSIAVLTYGVLGWRERRTGRDWLHHAGVVLVLLIAFCEVLGGAYGFLR
ncbi:hypothetical protein [Pseudobythopirellula maris]|uniref:hypothetical protein n=1 Tax=Pseudobythopirellula maris TaxID=2527991 RepID=UPI0011B763F8|nr:hypothetical protein [Pseudobythopirellula maris]